MHYVTIEWLPRPKNRDNENLMHHRKIGKRPKKLHLLNMWRERPRKMSDENVEVCDEKTKIEVEKCYSKKIHEGDKSTERRRSTRSKNL